MLALALHQQTNSFFLLIKVYKRDVNILVSCLENPRVKAQTVVTTTDNIQVRHSLPNDGSMWIDM